MIETVIINMFIQIHKFMIAFLWKMSIKRMVEGC